MIDLMFQFCFLSLFLMFLSGLFREVFTYLGTNESLLMLIGITHNK
jgi:hypothetical protein